MKKLKTSTKIVLKFIAFNSLILLSFAVVLNVLFFINWHSSMSQRIKNIPSQSGNMGHRAQMMQKFGYKSQLVEFSLDSDEAKIILENQRYSDISKIDDNFLIFAKINGRLQVLSVTDEIEAQLNLIRISLVIILVFGLLSYWIGGWFVRSSLYKLNELVLFMNDIDINNLDKKIDMDLPEGDVIKSLADKIDTLMTRLQTQTVALKDFVSNSAHELKTPLAVIQTQIDLVRKTKDFENSLDKIESKTKKINSLLDTLSMITKLEEKSISTTKITPSIIINDILLDLKTQYGFKEISLETNIDKNLTLEANKRLFQIVLKNLIQNAYKYTDKGIIKVQLTKDKFVIQDSGQGISQDSIDRIWERFWQEDTSKTDIESFGLGLYIVRKIVDKHNWSIQVQSQKGDGTKFIIKFN